MSWSSPPNSNSKPIVFVTHDESTFNANDGRRSGWIKDKQMPLRPKGQGKGIMVSAFLTPGGILKIPDSIPDEEILARHPDWQKTADGKTLVREAVRYLEFGKDNYWTGDKMVEHAIQAAKIFQFAFPQCRGLFAFDNAPNHSVYAADALVADRMGLNPGGKQPKMRDGYIHARNRPQRMIFSSLHPKYPNQPKGLQQILVERNLWREHNSFGKFLLKCASCPKSGIDHKQCCARAVIANQPDFLQQKGRLEEELTRLGLELIFYPKFHCELNFIERFWCSAKHYARDNCSYSLQGLRETVPNALHSVSATTINNYFNHCDRTIDAYAEDLTYGTKEFTTRMYKSHRQVKDSTKN